LSKKKTFIDKGIQFLREVKVELKKVTWPSRKQTMGSTVVVLGDCDDHFTFSGDRRRGAFRSDPSSIAIAQERLSWQKNGILFMSILDSRTK
jgi:hypothetical protein